MMALYKVAHGFCVFTCESEADLFRTVMFCPKVKERSVQQASFSVLPPGVVPVVEKQQRI